MAGILLDGAAPWRHSRTYGRPRHNPGIVGTVERLDGASGDTIVEARPPARAPRAPRGRRREPRLRWVAPVVAFLGAGIPFLLVHAIAAVVAVFVVVLVWRRPRPALTLLLVVLPFQQLVFSGLYKLGLPAELVRPAGQWKEGIVAGLLVAGFGRAVRDRHKLDTLDVVGLLYVTLGFGYLVVPGAFIGADALGTGLPFNTRLLGWRTDVMYVALFLACRHLRFTLDDVRAVVRWFLGTAAVVAAIALFEFSFQSTWNRLWIETLELIRYKLEVLRFQGLTGADLFDVRVYTSVGGRQVLRVGSVLLNYWALADYLVVASALLADRIVRGQSQRFTGFALTLCAGVVVLTVTRSAVLGLVVVLASSQFRRSRVLAPAVAPDGGSDRAWLDQQRAAGARVRFGLFLGGLAIVALPVAGAIGLVDRFEGEDDFSSNESHQNSFEKSIDTLSENPLGRGLATGAGAGQRADVSNLLVTETQVLQIATQLGVAGLALWVTWYLGAIVAMGRVAAHAPPGTDTGPLVGMRTALIGLLVAGLFLQVFIEFTLTWTTMALAGAALGATEQATRAAPGTR